MRKVGLADLGLVLALVLAASGCEDRPAEVRRLSESTAEMPTAPTILREKDVWVRLARDADGRVICEVDRVAAPQRSTTDRYEGVRGLPPGPDLGVVEKLIAQRSRAQPRGGAVIDHERGVPWKYLVDVLEIVRRLEIDDVAFTHRERAAP